MYKSNPEIEEELDLRFSNWFFACDFLYAEFDGAFSRDLWDWVLSNNDRGEA